MEGIRSLFGSLREKVAGKHVKIVFPEGDDERVVRAAARLKFEGLVDPIILGKPEEVRALLAKLGFEDPKSEIIDPETYEDFEAMKEEFVNIRKGKATLEDADKMLRDVNYFGVMLVKWDLLMVWYLVRFIQLQIQFVQRFKSSKQNLAFLVHQVFS